MTSGWTQLSRCSLLLTALSFTLACSLPQSHPLAPPHMPYLLLTKPSSLIKDWYLIRSYNQSGVCSVEGGSHALWRPCPHSTRFSSRQSTDWFRGLGWEYFFGGWKIVSHVAGVGN